MTTSKTNIRIGNVSVITCSFMRRWVVPCKTESYGRPGKASSQAPSCALSAVGLRTSIFVASGANFHIDITPIIRHLSDLPTKQESLTYTQQDANQVSDLPVCLVKYYYMSSLLANLKHLHDSVASRPQDLESCLAGASVGCAKRFSTAPQAPLFLPWSKTRGLRIILWHNTGDTLEKSRGGVFCSARFWLTRPQPGGEPVSVGTDRTAS